MFVSLHHSDHECVVRMLVGLSCELWGLIIQLITLHYITLHYAAQFFPYQECNSYITRYNFSPTRSVIHITWNNFSLPGCNSKKDRVLCFYYLMHAHCEWYVPRTYASSTMSQHQKSLEVLLEYIERQTCLQPVARNLFLAHSSSFRNNRLIWKPLCAN